MAKPELGTKRLCPGCGAKYYDLNRNPITCPKCGTLFDVVSSARAAKASRVIEQEDDEDEEEDLVAPELVTLEEADAEVEGDVVPDLEEDEEADIGDEPEDDVFIDDEDEEDESVPGIVLEIDDDTDR
ncbi:TIGR02300 family protein [Microvirga tunisiensis]|uniref:TIGR02300 family protein n=2 Tax=Pannonibacter tanglangensis TaxID=2750084 RepID=A0A7X5JAG7_9HYPH|nr:TIGR02300 family protein [Pannonibacter sp. XCT-34]NBN79992.1 TIGR02300 family protein [Pannonibacter sp. XCT-53]